MTIAIKKTYLLVYCRWNEARFWESNPSVWAQNNECVSPNRPPTCPDLSNSMLPMFPERNHNLEQYWLQASVREDLNLRCWDTKQRSLLYTVYEFTAAIVEVFGPEVREQRHLNVFQSYATSNTLAVISIRSGILQKHFIWNAVDTNTTMPVIRLSISKLTYIIYTFIYWRIPLPVRNVRSFPLTATALTARCDGVSGNSSFNTARESAFFLFEATAATAKLLLRRRHTTGFKLALSRWRRVGTDWRSETFSYAVRMRSGYTFL